MFRNDAGTLPQTIDILLVQRFSMLALFSAIEPLRLANQLAGRELFRWRLISVDGRPVAASIGMDLPVDRSIADSRDLRSLTICAGFEPLRYVSKPLSAWLRQLDRQGAELGALDTGAYILAAAGLLEGHRVSLHWESAAGFAELYPDIEITNELFTIDRSRFSCAGGMAALDMMLHLIALRHGKDLSVAISDRFIHDRIRNRTDLQRMPIEARLRVQHRKLLHVVELMEQNIESPLSLTELAAQSDLSHRQMERLFAAHLSETPIRYYRGLRLQRARQLLRHTEMRILDVAIACGFPSMAYFCRAYRAQFGCTPGEDRNMMPPVSLSA